MGLTKVTYAMIEGALVNVLDYGADSTGTDDSTTAIQAAIDAAAAIGGKVVGQGTFKTTAKIVIKCAFDGSDMTFNVTGSPAIALEVSTGSAANPTDIFSLSTENEIVLPSLVNIDKPTTGWVGQGIGVRYVNVQNAKITERLVKNFAVGVLHTCYQQGCGYNTVQGGYLLNNGVNRQVSVGDSSGFTNRWDIFGGRYFHYSAEGTAVAGVYHILIDANATGNIINDWNFFGASLEGNAEEYQVKCGGAYVNFYGCRWETSGGARVHFSYNGIAGQGSSNAFFIGRGADASDFDFTADANAGNRIYVQSSTGRSLISVAGVPYVMRGTSSSAYPIIAGYETTTDIYSANPLTDYSAFFGSQKVGGKRSADAYDRIYMNLSNGTVYVGDGTVAPTSGSTGTFTTADGKTVTVRGGIVIGIV